MGDDESSLNMHGILNQKSRDIVDTFEQIGDAQEQINELDEEHYTIRPVRRDSDPTKFLDSITNETYSDQTG